MLDLENAPDWCLNSFQALSSMEEPPEHMGMPYVCFRTLDENELRLPFVLDYWQPEGFWGSPHIGHGTYCGYFKIPDRGWQLGEGAELGLVHLGRRFRGFYELARGFYIGRCESVDGSARHQWRVLPDLARGDVPKERQWLRVPTEFVSWLPLPAYEPSLLVNM